MANVRDVAHFFIDLAQHQSANETGDLMTNLRLQKLLYFAQGWHLARFAKPLFDAPLAAWRYGPVVPEIYQMYKRNGAMGIDEPSEVPADAFTNDEYDLLLDVAREYGAYSTQALVELSHAPKAPWSHTEQFAEIPKNEIQAYFAGKDDQLLSFDEILDGYPVEAL